MSASATLEDRYCDQCGSLLPAVARFCGLCGAPAADLAGQTGAVADGQPFPVVGKIGLALGAAVGIVGEFVQSPDSFLGLSLPAGRLAIAGGAILLVSILGLTTGWIRRSTGIGLASAAAILWVVQAIDLALTAELTLSVTMLGAGGAIALITLGTVSFLNKRNKTARATPIMPLETTAESDSSDSDSSPEPTLGPPPIPPPRATVIREPGTEEESVPLSEEGEEESTAMSSADAQDEESESKP